MTIDDKILSQTPGTFALTRPSHAPYTWFPAIQSIKNNTPLVAEEWTLEFTSFTPDASSFTYKVTGSITGYDGEGKNDQNFVSKSGRMVIDGGKNWIYVPWSLKYKKKQMPSSFSVKWKVYPMFLEELQFSASKNTNSERTVTIVQGCSNGKHVLCLTPLKKLKFGLIGFRSY